MKEAEQLLARLKKTPQINECNYDRDGVEMALYSKQEICSAKLAKAKATSRNYEMKIASAPEITMTNPAFDSLLTARNTENQALNQYYN